MNVLRTHAEVEADPRWRLVLQRERDASFVYAVATTGTYCRPSCPARRPRPANVEFFATAAEAQRAGYRPCKRCRPSDTDPQLAGIEAACRALQADPTMGLAALAQHVGVSASHLHRRFKAALGITPAAYAAAQRRATFGRRCTPSGR